VAQEPVKRVLILSGSDPNYAGFSIITKNIASILRTGSRSRVEIVYELQQSLIEPPESPSSDEELAAYLKQKYADKKFDVILSMVAPRARIVLEKDPQLFQDIPKIFYEFDSERDATNRSLGPNITGVWADLNPIKTLDFAFTLNPDIHKVVVISGVGPEDGLKLERAQVEFRKYESRAEFSYLTGHTIEELKRELAALDKNSVVIFLLFTRDKAGNRYSGPETIPLLAPASNAPIYGYSDTLMGLGITGGNLLDFEGTGKRIGVMAQRVLAGEPPEHIPQEIAPTITTVDWREFQRFGMSEKHLPSGTVVRFRQPSFWELYKWYAIGLIAAVIFEALLIAWLLFLRVRRRQAEDENLRLARVAEGERRRLGEIVSNVPGIVWESLIDPATKLRKTTFISDYLRKMLGYTPEEWLAAKDLGLRIMPEEDRQEAIRVSEAVIASGKEGSTQFRWQARDGRTVWAENYLSPIFDRNEKVVGLRGVTLDITERKRDEESLRRTEEKNRAILNAIPDLMFLQSRDGVFLDCHASDSSALLAPVSELLGKSMSDILPRDIADQFAVCFERTDETAEPQILEYQLTINDTEHWFEARIVRSGENILTVVRDITQRIVIERKIKRNEEQLAGIIGSAMDAIITIDEKQHILLFNEAAEKIFGCTSAEMLGQPIDRLIPERFRGAHREHIRGFSEKQVTRKSMGQLGELYGLKSSGEEFPLEASISQIQLNEQKFYTVILRDVTERNRAIDELRQSEERFSKAFHANPQPMSVTTMAEGRYVDINDSFLEMSGYKRGEVIGRSSLELKTWEVPESRADFIREVQQFGSVVNIETKFRTKDGSLRLLLSSAEQLDLGGERCLIIASSDITERKKAEDALRESRARLLLAHQASRMGTFEWNIQTGINVWSPELEAMYGLAPGGLSKSQPAWEDLVYPDDRERAIATVRKALETGNPVEEEWRVKWPDGSLRWLFGRFQVFQDAAGAPERVVGINIDITERMESQEALRVAHEEVTRLKNQLQAENIYLQEEIRLEQHFGEIIGESDALKHVLFKIEQVAPTDSTVLITGETGTGKELVARAIHHASSRRDRPLVKVNCGALSASLIESELFGHEKGAFTGASARKIGRFELANGATIFLDEIGELPTDLQVKLLRVIQEGEFERLGSSKTIKVDVRIIAATNRNLDQEVRKGLFREDLWYRLNVFPITVPALRERREDVPLLVEHFVGMFGKKLRKVITSIAPTTLRSLSQYSWPGNIRELANVIERAVINSNGSVLRIGEDFVEPGLEKLIRNNKTLDELERDYIGHILNETAGKIEGPHGAARVLGINPSTLRARIIKLGVHKPGNRNNNS